MRKNLFLIAVIITLCIFGIYAKNDSSSGINIKEKFLQVNSENMFEDFINCISSFEYRSKDRQPIFFKDPHTIEVPSEYGVLTETTINDRVMLLRYVKDTVNKIVFIDIIENRCIRVLTVKN